MERTLDISIIGPGRVGTAIGVLAARAGWPVVAVAGRRAETARAAAEAIGHGAGVRSPAEAAAAGRLVLLTVPDDAIAAVCEELAAAGAFAAGAVVAHCSGALASEVLSPARQRCRCEIGSMHPLQTFPTAAAAIRQMAGTHCFCEGDPPAVAVLERLAGAVGARPVRIDAAGKARYHAAAVMACNYLVALMEAAAALAESAGIDRATWLSAAGPLVRSTVDNVLRTGPVEALTGPIARGDVETVTRHAEAMREAQPLLRELYAAAGRWTLELARSKGTLDAAKVDAIRERLNHFLPGE